MRWLRLMATPTPAVLHPPAPRSMADWLGCMPVLAPLPLPAAPAPPGLDLCRALCYWLLVRAAAAPGLQTGVALFECRLLVCRAGRAALHMAAALACGR